MTAGAAEVRRPWLPAGCARTAGPKPRSGRSPTSSWTRSWARRRPCCCPPGRGPTSKGRVRFAVDDSTRGVTVDVHALEHALYRGWLDRQPRIRDVFAAVVPQEVHDLQEPDEAPQWDRPIADLVDGPSTTSRRRAGRSPRRPTRYW